MGFKCPEQSKLGGMLNVRAVKRKSKICTLGVRKEMQKSSRIKMGIMVREASGFFYLDGQCPKVFVFICTFFPLITLP